MTWMLTIDILLCSIDKSGVCNKYISKIINGLEKEIIYSLLILNLVYDINVCNKYNSKILKCLNNYIL